MSARGRTRSLSSSSTQEDQEWLKLTEGLEPYERFRYIAKHVLQAAVQEASAYAVDPRIFQDLRASGELEELLWELEAELREDEDVSPFERAFLCAAVTEAMALEDLESACPWELFHRLRLAVHSAQR